MSFQSKLPSSAFQVQLAALQEGGMPVGFPKFFQPQGACFVFFVFVVDVYLGHLTDRIDCIKVIAL